jgi:hypothetical protein
MQVEFHRLDKDAYCHYSAEVVEARGKLSSFGTANRMQSRTQSAFYSRPHDAVICVYDQAGNVMETHEHKGDFKEP